MANRRGGLGIGVESNTVDVVIRITADRKDDGPRYPQTLRTSVFASKFGAVKGPRSQHVDCSCQL
jgi:hypothetical protein